jgi:hypothetical protein
MQRYNIFLKAPKYLNNCYAETNSSPFHWSLRPFSLRYFTPVARGRVFLPRTFVMVYFQCGPSPNHRVRLMDAVMVKKSIKYVHDPNPIGASPQVVENASRGLRAPPMHHRNPIDYFRILPLDILPIFYNSAARLGVQKKQRQRSTRLFEALRTESHCLQSKESNIVRI